MQIQSSRKSEVKIHRRKKVERLFSYNDVPNHEFTIDDFEQLAISRVNVLKYVEKQRALGNPLSLNILKENDLSSKLKDSLSHYILRMCYCQTEDLRRWFISMELALFEERYKSASLEDKQRIIRELTASASSDDSDDHSNNSNKNSNNSNNSSNSNHNGRRGGSDSSVSDGIYETFDKAKILATGLNAKSPIFHFDPSFTIAEEARVLPYHKVPFAHVLSLVAKRLVYLKDGFAYVPNHLFATIIIGKFRSHLSKGLTHASKALQSLHNDPIAMSQAQRVIHIIDGLHKINSTSSYKQTGKSGMFRARDIDDGLVDRHFPLCMQNSYYALKRDGHIKHGTRMSFGLFLKGVGVPYIEAHSFFKTKFFKMGADKFEKQHRYTFRHLYGLEGKRTNYTAFGCNKLISTQPNAGDHHGCPFKLFDDKNLRKVFKNKGNMSGNDINAVMEFVGAGHCQLACRKYFEIQHRSKFLENKRSNSNISQNLGNQADAPAPTCIEDIASTWSHPNEYFDKSYQVWHPNSGSSRDERDQKQKNAVQQIVVTPVHTQQGQVGQAGQLNTQNMQNMQNTQNSQGSVPLIDVTPVKK